MRPKDTYSKEIGGGKRLAHSNIPKGMAKSTQPKKIAGKVNSLYLQGQYNPPNTTSRIQGTDMSHHYKKGAPWPTGTNLTAGKSKKK